MSSEEKDTILKIGSILNRKYKVEKYLGGGAFGEVYRVKNTFLNKRFAIKVFRVSLDLQGNESSVQELLEEAQILAKFDHRNIVKVHDADSFVTNDGEEHVFFVMDFVPGGDLDDYWKSYGARFVPLDITIDIIKQICLGLNVLHSERPPMIHRDIKPQNIMIGYDNHGVVAKLTDFGLVKTVNPSTLYASAKGTLAFKAPEFLEEKDDTSTDIFAVGVTFYMLLTDKLPYPIDSEFDVMTGNWLKNEPKPLSYYNPLVHDEELENIVFTAISTDPENRYRDAQELLDAITSWENSKDEKPPEQKVVKESTVQEPEEIVNKESKQSNKPDGGIDNSKEYAEKKVEKAKDLAKDPQAFAYASDAFENAFAHNSEVREENQENLEILNSPNPPEMFVERAIKAVNNTQNYEKGVDYLEQAFAQKSEFKQQYGDKLELWKSFILIQNLETVDEGINKLKDLANEYPSIKDDYGFAFSILSTKDAKRLESEALKNIDNNDPKKASSFMELAMLLDVSIRNRYRYKLRNWKNGILN